MKLARKLTAALVLGILAVMGVYASFQLHQEVVLSQADTQRARRVALAWMGVIEAVWQREGPARAQELAQRATERAGDIRLRLLPLDAAAAGAELRLSADELRTLLQGEEGVRRVHTDADGQAWRQIYIALTVHGEHPGVVEYLEPMAPERTFIDMSHRAIAMATLAIVVVCGLIASAVQYRLVGRPLQLVCDKARRAGAGDFSAPLVLRQQDEIGELAAEVNAMCARIDEANRKLAAESEARLAALEQLRHTDRLATVGQLAAGVAHELGTPLNIAAARAELIAAASPADAEIVHNARVIVEQSDRMTAIIQQLLDFSRRRGATLTHGDLRQVVARTLDLLSSAATGVDVVCDMGDTAAPVRMDQNQMQQALTNIVLNGIQAMPNGGRLRVHLESRSAQPPAGVSAPAGEYACLTVEDEGTGIRAADLPRVFEPFFTTKSVGEGTGLGLAVAHGIVAEHGGWITVDSVEGRGSRFSILLPRVPAAAEAAQGAA